MTDTPDDVPVLPGWFGPQARQAIAWAAAAAVTKGWISSDAEPLVIGFGMAAAGYAWTLISRHRTRKALKDAIAAPAGMAR